MPPLPACHIVQICPEDNSVRFGELCIRPTVSKKMFKIFQLKQEIHNAWTFCVNGVSSHLMRTRF